MAALATPSLAVAGGAGERDIRLALGAGGGGRGGRREEAALTDHHQDVRGDCWDKSESLLPLELAEDFPFRREAVGAEVEREDLVVVEVGEVGTEGESVVERREASQPGGGEEEPGDEVGGEPGGPSSSTAW